MISHKHKCIFIHIPKCAGSSIKDHLFDGQSFNWKEANYEFLYGWCPKRKIHLQHATAKELLETELITEDIWKEYFKFTFVRNPWDRAYSDYLWIMKDRKILGSFQDYINSEAAFKEIFTNKNIKSYRGDHKYLQSDFFDIKGNLEMDFIGRFENLRNDMETINNHLGISNNFNRHSKKNLNRKAHYSYFYNAKKRKLVEEFFRKDIQTFNYSFDDQKRGLKRLKNFF